MIVTVAPFLAAQQPDPVLAEKPRGKPVQLGSGQAMRLSLERKSVERLRKDRERAGGYQTLSPAHHECPGGIPHVQGIVCNSTNTQALTIEDCPVIDGSYADFWSFPGFANQQVTIEMSSSAFDTYLFLLGPSQETVAVDDDGGSGTNSRIVFTLTETGTWFIATNSFFPNVFGPYTVTLTCEAPQTPPSPTPTRSPTIHPTTIPTLMETPTPAATSLPISQDPTCLRPGSLGCPSSTVTAQLTTADCPLDDGSYYDVFRFSGTEGQTLTILMSSGAFDTFLFLQNPAGNVVASDDDSGGGTNSRLVFTLPTTGAWTILANSFFASEFGPYILSLNCAGGIGPTATPLGAPPPTDIPTLSFPALLLLMVLLTTIGFFFLRRG